MYSVIKGPNSFNAKSLKILKLIYFILLTYEHNHLSFLHLLYHENKYYHIRLLQRRIKKTKKQLLIYMFGGRVKILNDQKQDIFFKSQTLLHIVSELVYNL